jgi:phosphate transport system permease protein
MSTQAAPPVPAGEPEPRRRSPRATTSRKRLWTDKAARWTVTAGGFAIIASILGILLFILVEVLPLTSGARVEPGRELPLRGGVPGAVVADEHRSHVAVLSHDGRVRVTDLESGEQVNDRPFLAGSEGEAELSAIAGAPGQQLLTAATTAGTVAAQRVEWNVSFEGDLRVVSPRFPDPVVFDLDPEGGAVGPFTARVDENGSATAAARLSDGSLAVVHRELEENLFTGETSEAWSRHVVESPPGLTVLLMDGDQRNLYGGTESGELFWWTLSAGETNRQAAAAGDSAAVTALTLLIGDRSLVVGRADGSLSVWFPVRQDDKSRRLTKVREFPSQGGPIRLLAPSMRNKGFVAQDASGQLGLYYSTSERTLWRGRAPLADARALFYSPKADSLLEVAPGRLVELEIDNPHPEVSLRALFGKVWYEGYGEPAYVWQSTGGTDDFEPKLSMTPLMIGTLKGTFYSLVLAIPLGVLGALYASHFMHPHLKRYVKPTVEIMAALPSVVLGFLAGLWLAPRIEQIFPSLLLMLVVLPVIVLATGLLWRAVPLAVRGLVPVGSETMLYMMILALGIWLCLGLNHWIEAVAFGGDFQARLLDLTGLRYDQRNAIVVGLAMGFAVIPIIFSIAEDAFSNVPPSLVSGSLALGANRWQTATRVVVPTASPGIFSAIMIGFGRAVGETMIVLMATGNTPVLDWNPFNGFRTLSANIAVEIPEAPQGETLYRTLFFAALLLFIFTFLLNTAGEVVRQRLRKRFAEI